MRYDDDPPVTPARVFTEFWRWFGTLPLLAIAGSALVLVGGVIILRDKTRKTVVEYARITAGHRTRRARREHLDQVELPRRMSELLIAWLARDEPEWSR